MAPLAADAFRLPKTVVPDRYEIRLEPDLERFTFAGEESVSVTIREPVTEIVLNAAELQIHQVSIQYGQGVTLKGEATPDATAERARLTFPETLRPGVWRLTLQFTGVLNDKLHGFYRSTYKAVPEGGGDAQEKVLAAVPGKERVRERALCHLRSRTDSMADCASSVGGDRPRARDRIERELNAVTQGERLSELYAKL